MKSISVVTWIVSIFLLSVLLTPYVMAEEGIGMVTGSKTGTYIKFGQQISEKVKTAGIHIIVKESEGSIANIERLNSSENAALAIVQSDVLGFLKRLDSAEMRSVAEKLRLIFPFYNEEVHLFAKKEIKGFKDLQGKRVVLGTEGSGTWLTATNLLGIAGVEPGEEMYLPTADAVAAVLLDDADAMFYVAGKPVKLFTNLNEVADPEIAELLESVHFVPLDDQNMLQEYVSSEIGPSEYTWLDTAVSTVAVKAVLISFDFSAKQTPYYKKRCQQLAKIGKAIRTNIDELKQTGHPKWQEVSLEEKVGIWELDACSRALEAPPKTQPETQPETSKKQRLRDLLKKKLSQ